ncbi:MAG: cyclic nucleotide-binding domain-containing protein [Alphaproteobacteria bacterium]|nr:cyclic nucleotide-binding domain-containing protein [Alphaproteobacteria bacterium]
MLITIEKVLVLKQIPLFKTVSNMALSDLMAVSEEQTLKKEMVLVEGTKQNRVVYFILSGSAASERGKIFGAHEAVGLDSVFWVSPARETIKTTEDCVVLKVARDKLYRMMALHPSLATALLHELSRLIHEK